MFCRALVACLFLSAPAFAAEPFRIAGYLPDYRAASYDLAHAKSLTDLIVFSAEPTAAGELDRSRLKNVPWEKLRAFKTKDRVRLILCIGGWNRSQHFATVATSAEKRKAFVAATVKACLDGRLDGVDLDWEHPANAAEQDGYAKLLDELRDAFRPHGLTLAVTIAGWQKLSREAFAAVDWINVMAYDHDGQHSTFDGAKADVQKLVDQGAPKAKITLGLPFYGRDPKTRDRTLTYREIVAKNAPAADVDEVDGVYFNGPATIGKKVDFAKSEKLAGVMVWELGQDASGDASLLKAIAK